MKMNRIAMDEHFLIGADHYRQGMPCQDYAISGEAGEIAYAIVSDGCSSGGRTDVGSRATAFACAQALTSSWSDAPYILPSLSSGDIIRRHRARLGVLTQELMLTERDMLATLIYIFATPQGVLVTLWGDGVIAVKYRDGHMALWRYDWEDNMPLYPAYGKETLGAFVSAHGGDVKLDRLKEEFVMLQGDTVTYEHTRWYTLGDALDGVTKIVPRDALESRIDSIAVFTDGVTQICQKGRADMLDWKDAVRTLLAFPNTTGSFAKRRMIRAMRGFEKEGYEPRDDIAYAVMRIASRES
jgi:hypothetical protein